MLVEYPSAHRNVSLPFSPTVTVSTVAHQTSSFLDGVLTQQCNSIDNVVLMERYANLQWAPLFFRFPEPFYVNTAFGCPQTIDFTCFLKNAVLPSAPYSTKPPSKNGGFIVSDSILDLVISLNLWFLHDSKLQFSLVIQKTVFVFWQS